VPKSCYFEWLRKKEATLIGCQKEAVFDWVPKVPILSGYEKWLPKRS